MYEGSAAMLEPMRPRYATEPLYNIKAVVQQTGIPSDTIRAWERRYGVPQPRRTSTRRRLYSERDIATVRWLRDRTTSGMAISQAIEQLRTLGDEVFSPALVARESGPRSREQLAGELLEALLMFDRQVADAVIEEAFTLYPVEEVCLELFAPVLVEIGERWRRQEASVAQEHFASYVIQRRLAGLLQVYNMRHSRSLIVAACAPGELHELGLLMLAVFLTRRGWQVVYLGASVPLPDLLATVNHLQPDLVCLSAMHDHTSRTLSDAVAALVALPAPRPAIAYGGRAFLADPEARARIDAHYLGDHAGEAVAQAERFLA